MRLFHSKTNQASHDTELICGSISSAPLLYCNADSLPPALVILHNLKAAREHPIVLAQGSKQPVHLTRCDPELARRDLLICQAGTMEPESEKAIYCTPHVCASVARAKSQ